MKCQGAKNIKRRSLQFWKRWQNEYLTELRVHCNFNLKNRQPTINVGDVVWSMGVIKSFITERGGDHRGAVVRMRRGDRVIEVTRP